MSSDSHTSRYWIPHQTEVDLERQVSILMPTYNRTLFIRRALGYYKRMQFQGPIIVGDSSHKAQAEKNRQIIHQMNGSLNLTYLHYPKENYTVSTCFRELLELVHTPFAVYGGDDDFLIPHGLNTCVAFLKENPDYSAVHGYRVNVRLSREAAHGRIIAASLASDPESQSDFAFERWVQYIRTGLSSHVYVHPTDVFKRIYQEAEYMDLYYLGTECFPCSMTWVLGKVKKMACVTLVYQRDNSFHDWNRKSLFSLINHPRWAIIMNKMRDTVTRSIAESDGMDMDQAEALFDREMWLRVMNVLNRQFNRKYYGVEENIENDETLKRLMEYDSPFLPHLRPVFSLVEDPSLLRIE